MRNEYSGLSETAWRNVVVELATFCGWRCFYVENSTREITRRSGARVRVRNINVGGVGFPDLVMVRGRDARLIFAELKRDLGPRGGGATQGGHKVETSPEQEAWLADIEEVANVVMYDAGDRIGLMHALAPEPPPPIGVYVWRPSDYEKIKVILAP